MQFFLGGRGIAKIIGWRPPPPGSPPALANSGSATDLRTFQIGFVFQKCKADIVKSFDKMLLHANLCLEKR